MNKMSKDILNQIIKTKNVKAFNEYSEIELSGKLIIDSYSGSELRVFNHNDKTHLLFPMNGVTPIQEGTLADAIENGTIFDDADKVENAAKYAIGTSLPLRALANKNIELPTGMHTIAKSIVGTLDDDCRAYCGQIEIDNTSQCMKDIIEEPERTVDIVDDYLDMDDEDIPNIIASSIVNAEKALRDIVLSPDDELDDDDYDVLEIEEGFFSMLTPDMNAKLIYHLNTMNDVINNPVLPDTPQANDKALNVLDECNTEGRQVSKITAKCAENGGFDRRTAHLLTVISTASEEISIAADAISNPFLKPEDIMYNEKGTKEAVNKWNANKEILKKTIPQVLSSIEQSQSQPVTEAFLSNKPKKLKDLKIRDTVTYIQIEINDIRDVNDQQILSGYVCSKLELVDFYISCIDNNDPKYIVPHSRPQLVQFQNDLNRLLTQILKTRPVNRADRTWMVNVNYPDKWRG